MSESPSPFHSTFFENVRYIIAFAIVMEYLPAAEVILVVGIKVVLAAYIYCSGLSFLQYMRLQNGYEQRSHVAKTRMDIQDAVANLPKFAWPSDSRPT